MLWRRGVGVADAEIDYIFSLPAHLHLVLVDDVEYVWRKPLDPVKFLFQLQPLYNSCLDVSIINQGLKALCIKRTSYQRSGIDPAESNSLALFFQCLEPARFYIL